ncbi:glutamate racemase [Aurantibacter sp.]|uniref:glutamate racemase n=1 Tax=Aurantibacter sp. TaxID=2807103 RepID=UPI0035C860CD
MSKSPIGFFDSGVGGTSVFKAVNKLLPNESTIYLADSANAPYGARGKDWIIARCIENTELLLSYGCKIIVVACNTATTNAIKILRKTYNVPFIGIEPAIKPASLKTKTRAVGILATRGTLSSELFRKTTKLYCSDVYMVEQIGEGIVDLIESGKLYSEEMTLLLQTYLKPMIKANIDYLVLGCTHYPYLVPQLKKLLPKEVKIIDSGKAVANHTEAVLRAIHLLNETDKKPKHLFYSNGRIDVIQSLISKNAKVNYLDF